MKSILADSIINKIPIFFFLLARIGPAIGFMPGFGESFVNPRIRLAIALGITLIIFPLLENKISVTAEGFLIEIIIGLLVGLIARVIILAFDVAGSLMSMQSSLSIGAFFNPGSMHGGSLYSSLLISTSTVLIFALDLHHLFLKGLIASYSNFSKEAVLLPLDLVMVFPRIVSESFKLAIHIAAPFIVIQTLFLFASGLVNRLVSQIQIFFIVQPLQILLGFVTILLCMGAVLSLVIEFLRTTFKELFGVIS